MKKLILTAYRSNFLRAVTVLTTGSFVAQLIPLLMLPIFTRMYSAQLFGIQALLQVGAALVLPMATGFFDWAIPTPKEAARARALATLAVFLAFVLALITLVVVLLLHDTILALLHAPQMGHWIYTYPIVVLAMALTNIANYWLLRKGRFAAQTVNKIALAVVTAVLALLANFMHWQDGLLIGFTGGIIVGGVWAMAQAIGNGLSLKRASASYYWSIVKKYKHFPVFGSLPSTVNTLAMHIPLLIITAHYSLGTAGHYSVARNILASGVNLLAACIGQVVLKHISDRAHTNKRVWPEFKRILVWLTAFAFCLMVGVYIVGPWFFRLYLGHDWEDSARIVHIIAFNTFFWLIGPTLALAVIAVHKIKAVALWQLIYGVIASCLFFFTHLPFEQFLWRYVSFEIFAYGLYAVIMILAMRQHDREQLAKAKAARA